MRRLGWVEPDRAADVVELLGQAVPGLEFLVRKWPSRRRSVSIGDRLEVPRPITEQDGAVELRVAADIVVVAGIEGSAGSVEPGSSGGKRPAEKLPGRRAHRLVPRRRAPRSRMIIWAPVGARPAAAVAPPIPEPMIRMSTVSELAMGPAVSNRCDVWGSNSTALSRLKAKVWSSPMRSWVSARMRAVRPLPAARVTTNVSEPAGSTISTRASKVATDFAPRSMLSLSLTASGRMPKMTFAPSDNWLSRRSPGSEQRWVDGRGLENNSARAVHALDRPFKEIMAGEPIKSATKRLEGEL